MRLKKRNKEHLFQYSFVILNEMKWSEESKLRQRFFDFALLRSE